MVDKSIFTNEINLSFNDFNINKDFDIFSVSFAVSKKSSDNRFITTRMLDLSDMDFKAVSVLYRYGNYMFCMFRSHVILEDELKARIQEKSGIEVNVKLIDSRNPNQIKPAELAQLLCNSLVVLGDDRKFHNLLGKLLYFSSNSYFGKPNITKIVAANLSISTIEKTSQRCKLDCSVLSFHNQELLLKYAHSDVEKAQILSSSKFVLDSEYNFRKMVGSINDCSEKNIFIQKSLGKPNTIPFADFTTPDKFNSSKIGIINLFLEDVKEYLGNYLTISLKTVNNIKTKKNNVCNLLFKKEKEYFEAINGKSINLVNKAKDDVFSEEIIHRIFNQFISMGVSNIIISNECNKDCFNLVIIHDRDYYIKKRIEDAHQINFNVQHLILEKYYDKKTGELKDVVSIIRKCVYELMIKQDLQKECLTLYKEEIETPIHYAAISSYTDEKNAKHKRFYILTIKPDCSLMFDCVDKNSNMKLYQTLMKRVEHFNKIYEYSNDLKYIIYDENDAIMLMDNNIITIPDIKEGYKRVMNYSKKKTLSKENLIHYYKEFIKRNPQYQNKVNSILNTLEKNSKNEFTYEEITNNQKPTKKDRVEPLMPLSGGMAHDFLEFLRSEHNIVINMVLKDKHSSSLIKNQMTKINVFTNECDVFDNSTYYYVGSKQPLNGSKFEKAIHIKGLIPLKDNNKLIDKLINQLDVDFVRLGEYTVYPFPIKYLKEYIRIYNKNKM